MTDEDRPRGYLIALRHTVVALDLAQAVADFDPAAPVLILPGPAEALCALSQVTSLALAFVAEAPAAFRGSPLEAAIRARGGEVVLLGEAAELEGEAMGYAVLPRPFTAENVAACLTEAAARRTRMALS